MTSVDPRLGELRRRIDELDREFMRIVAARLEICREVAAVKEGSDTPVVQPARVRDVVTTRRQWAIDAGVDPDFAEQLFRVLLAETHRIEVAGHRPDAGAGEGGGGRRRCGSALDTVATRIDHVVVAVPDLDAAVASFTGTFGFHAPPLAGGDVPGVAALTAGGVTVVLVGAAAPRRPSLRTSTPTAVACSTSRSRCSTRATPAPRSPLQMRRCSPTVVIDADGHEQFFAARDRGDRACSSGSSAAPATGSASAPPTCLALFDTLVTP